jgi:hypothetical protein
MKTNYTTTLRAAAMRANKVIKEASEHSSWNFKNKVSNIQPLDDFHLTYISETNLVFCRPLYLVPTVGSRNEIT